MGRTTNNGGAQMDRIAHAANPDLAAASSFPILSRAILSMMAFREERRNVETTTQPICTMKRRFHEVKTGFARHPHFQTPPRVLDWD
jgi:hypothetical protein